MLNRPYFFWTPSTNFNYYATEKERDAAAIEAIHDCCDEGWTNEVKHIVAGKMTHTTQQVGRIERPAEAEINEEGIDRDGNVWHPDWYYQCDYKLLPIQQPEPPELKYPATCVSYWPSGPLFCCDKHAKTLETLACQMCCKAPIAALAEPQECQLCANEAKSEEVNQFNQTLTEDLTWRHIMDTKYKPETEERCVRRKRP